MGKQAPRGPDLLRLDVQGAEVEVMSGLALSRHAPSFFVAEDQYSDQVCDDSKTKGYERIKVLPGRRFARNCLYRSTP